MIEKVVVPWLSKLFPMQALNVVIYHGFVKVGFISATDNQKEVLSVFVRGYDVLLPTYIMIDHKNSGHLI